MTPRMQNSSCIGQHECEVIHTYLTRIVQVLCLGGHIHIEREREREREREKSERGTERETVGALSPLLTNQRQNMRKENRKQLNHKNIRKRCIQKHYIHY